MLLVVLWTWPLSATASPVIELDVEWASFLARADPRWNWTDADAASRPDEWVKSLFGGNGDLGFQLWSDTDASLRLVGRGLVVVFLGGERPGRQQQEQQEKREENRGWLTHGLLLQRINPRPRLGTVCDGRSVPCTLVWHWVHLVVNARR